MKKLTWMITLLAISMVAASPLTANAAGKRQKVKWS